MIAWIIVLCLAVIAVTAYLKPAWFKDVWETTLAWLSVAAVGAIPLLQDIALYLATDLTWADLIGDAYRPLALVAMGLLGIVIRRLNT